MRDAIIGEWEQIKKKLQKALPDFSDPAEAALAYADQAQKYAAEYRRSQKLLVENRDECRKPSNYKRAVASRARRIAEVDESKKPSGESKKPEEGADAPNDNPYERILRRIDEDRQKQKLLKHGQRCLQVRAK